ncbi:MAG: hypothetical protein LC802_22710 [Acidobacteria bacterium]|nr:hypothetical protein [Acidobacteriota bacterium]
MKKTSQCFACLMCLAVTLAVVGNSMLTKVDGAQAALAHGNVTAAVNKLHALEHEVEAQRGKRLADAEADRILALIAALLDSLS